MAIVRIMVKDVDASLPFYCDSLGFELVEKWGPAFAQISKDDLELWLSGPQTSAAKPMPDGSVPEPGGWNRVVLPVQGLEDFVAALKSLGSKFRNDVIEGPGGRQILVEDPSGNVIELFEPRD